ncbi:MAG TPA: YlxQ family RNA-binding protein [Bacillales bacterium]|nr:YlxQ family RNA-binding protein [Bacillales bacterium]HEU5140832.1 YlxQ family RNA-binding protein [Bacillales bacterium]
MRPAPWFSLVGLAFRAGKIVSGEEAVMSAVRGEKAKLVLVAEDASERTKGTWENKCDYYGVPLRIVADRYQLGGAMGKAHRVVAAVNDHGFSKKLIALLDQ